MVRFALILVVLLTSVLLAACSDLNASNCSEGFKLVDGTCSPDRGEDARFEDPLPKKKKITLGCTNNISSDVVVLGWDLTVDPGPIVGGEAFGAVFRGLVIIDESLVDESLMLAGGYNRSNLIELQATVRVRKGVTPDAKDVILRSEPIQRTCTYDVGGNIGLDAGPFPTCSEANDNPDDSNDDCTGLGGVPDPRNRCGEFSAIPTSGDCSSGGFCESRGKTGPGSQCALFGFCVSGPVELVLEGAVEAYIAVGSGNVVFGWDDQGTGAEIDETGGPNDGAWILPPAVFQQPAGPNGFRVLVDGVGPIAWECTMGVGETRIRPTPSSSLISFPIQTR